MARYASGKKAWGYSDRSGFRYRLRDMIKEWNGLKVGPDEYEPKHPQLEPNHPGPDPTALYQPRSDSRSEVTVERLLRLNPFGTIAGSNVVIVYEKSHGRSTGDVVRFRNCQSINAVSSSTLELATGYSISVQTGSEDNYVINVSDTATAGEFGGGGRVTAGPVTLEK